MRLQMYKSCNKTFKIFTNKILPVWGFVFLASPPHSLCAFKSQSSRVSAWRHFIGPQTETEQQNTTEQNRTDPLPLLLAAAAAVGKWAIKAVVALSRCGCPSPSSSAHCPPPGIGLRTPLGSIFQIERAKLPDGPK